jgi:hypothetical protein
VYILRYIWSSTSARLLSLKRFFWLHANYILLDPYFFDLSLPLLFLLFRFLGNVFESDWLTTVLESSSSEPIPLTLVMSSSLPEVLLEWFSSS